MDSGTLSADKLREKLRWGEGNKVYKRKPKSTNAAALTPVPSTANGNIQNGTADPVPQQSSQTLAAEEANCQPVPQQSSQTLAAEEANCQPVPQQSSQTLAAEEANCQPVPQQSSQTLVAEEANREPSSQVQETYSPKHQEEQQEKTLSRHDVVSDGSSSHNRPHQPQGAVSNGGESSVKPAVVLRVEDRLKINLAAGSKHEIRELRRKLVNELDQVRDLVKKLAAKESEIGGGYSHSHQSAGEANEMINNSALTRVNSEMQSTNNGLDHRRALLRVHSEVGSANDFIDRRALMRVNSEVGAVLHRVSTPFRHLSVSVMENNHNLGGGGGEYIEREKRTPKANQFYPNSDFLLGKDRLPPESKKPKTNSGRKHGGDAEYGYGMDKYRNQVFKTCSNLLQRLMKHKHGWVFNVPVNAKALGLHDYHDIIKHPMDFGTIKARLSQNFYKSAREFAEDVRLTFLNAMTYNPKGQDVHVMAEQLSTIFEERWAVIEVEYNTDLRYDTIYDLGLPTPTSRKAPPPPLTPQVRSLDRWDSMTPTINSRIRPSNFNSVNRIPHPKKPKAKDLDKRDMTYEEKQKLSTNLQNLPSEKLDNIVQIIKKGSSDLCQHDDEIEVDIDSVNAETLWELDRFVTNYKKGLSKSKRKAEIAKARADARLALQAMNPTPSTLEAAKESVTGEKVVNGSSPAQGEKHGGNVSLSSSSSTSSSDSSSSDSDSDSSSGSDAGGST